MSFYKNKLYEGPNWVVLMYAKATAERQKSMLDGELLFLPTVVEANNMKEAIEIAKEQHKDDAPVEEIVFATAFGDGSFVTLLDMLVYKGVIAYPEYYEDSEMSFTETIERVVDNAMHDAESFKIMSGVA